MPKQKQPVGKGAKSGFIVGRESFAKIGAVEGIHLTPAMKKRASDAKSKGMSAEEYRQVIVRACRKG